MASLALHMLYPTGSGQNGAMLLNRLAQASDEMAAVSSRNAKRGIIAAALSEASPEEMAITASYLAGTLRQRRTGVGSASLRSLPDAAEEPRLSLTETDAKLDAIADLAGPGSAAVRTERVHDLFGRATTAEQRLLIGLITGELRQGALDSLVQDGLAAAFDVPATTVRRAAMLLGSTAETAVLLHAGGRGALDAVELRVGLAVQPMLAASAPDVAGAVERVNLPVVVDHKLDGIRIQVHRDGDHIRAFTRSLEDITERLPDVVAAVAALPVQTVVLDGEVVAEDATGAPKSFQITASRTATRAERAVPELVPLAVYFFDLLHLDGRDLLTAPLSERAELMRSLLPAELIVPRVLADDADQVAEVFTEAVDAGFEGVVVKAPHGTYAAGRRAATWVKVKPRYTLDLVVLGAEWGHGRRQGRLSNLHLAARDGDELVMLGKTFKGLTDELLAWQTETFLALETRRTGTTVFIAPEVVVEIACDGIQNSTRYPGGVTLRFARVLRYRRDKTADEADTLDTVRSLAGRGG